MPFKGIQIVFKVKLRCLIYSVLRMRLRGLDCLSKGIMVAYKRVRFVLRDRRLFRFGYTEKATGHSGLFIIVARRKGHFYSVCYCLRLWVRWCVSFAFVPRAQLTPFIYVRLCVMFGCSQ